MKKIIIIGGGVVGLCLAYEISKNRKFQVFLIEKNRTFGLEASTKNSEVIKIDRDSFEIIASNLPALKSYFNIYLPKNFKNLKLSN